MPAHKFNENVEGELAKIVVDGEYKAGRLNKDGDLSDFEAYIDMFDAERTEKDYDWMSDVFIPEFPSQMLTQASLDVDQYFQTRDFVEVYIEDEGEAFHKAAYATQELINRTLNRRDLFHYMKFVRAKGINHLLGHVDIKCWWEQEMETEFDEDPTTGDLIEVQTPLIDRFNYEVLDPRNVFTDDTYCYSMQERSWVIVRSEKTLNDLKDDQEAFGYFNLKILEEIEGGTYDTMTKIETTDADSFDGAKIRPKNTIGPYYDILERFGEFWITDNGKPGITEDGEVKKNAHLAEIVMTFALSGGTKILIGFHETPYRSADGIPYKPLIRGLCYVHPTRDAGVGDGKYAKELQVGINDTFNVSADRTMLATMPTLKGKKYVTEDTDTIYFEPQHLMELENPDDVVEFQISDNIQGAMTQLGVLSNKMQQTTSIYPTTMGDVPAMSSTTATAVAGAEQRTNQRTNYKSMTFEYTALTELYWMIQQMTWEFAHPETGEELMGEKVYDFDPTLNYSFKPLSQSIETAHAKNVKTQRWIQMLGFISNIGHPDAVNIFNYIIARVAELQGDEFTNFANIFLREGIPLNPQETAGQPGGMQAGGPSNQSAIPQSAPEQMARQTAGGGFY